MKHLNLEEARKQSGHTGQEIAEALGISRSQLYRIEGGECQAPFALSRRMRAYWPRKLVPDLAIYDPQEFERVRAGQGKRQAAA